MVAASAGRRGRPWRRVRQQVLQQSTVCWLCGHPASGEVDHHPPRAELQALGLDPNDAQYLRPAHGARSPCPTCGLHCNQLKGSKLDWSPPRAQSRDW